MRLAHIRYKMFYHSSSEVFSQVDISHSSVNAFSLNDGPLEVRLTTTSIPEKFSQPARIRLFDASITDVTDDDSRFILSAYRFRLLSTDEAATEECFPLYQTAERWRYF